MYEKRDTVIRQVEREMLDGSVVDRAPTTLTISLVLARLIKGTTENLKMINIYFQNGQQLIKIIEQVVFPEQNSNLLPYIYNEYENKTNTFAAALRD